MPRLSDETLRERARRDKPALRSRDRSAQKLNVHVRTIDRLVRRGKLRGVKVGSRMMIEDDSIDAFIASGGQWAAVKPSALDYLPIPPHGPHEMRYLRAIPASADVPSGLIVVHNHVRPAHRLGLNGFRAWTQIPGERTVACFCGWATKLGPHYRMARADDVSTDGPAQWRAKAQGSPASVSGGAEKAAPGRLWAAWTGAGGFW
jgi:excisionase family DNA binding protein